MTNFLTQKQSRSDWRYLPFCPMQKLQPPTSPLRKRASLEEIRTLPFCQQTKAGAQLSSTPQIMTPKYANSWTTLTPMRNSKGNRPTLETEKGASHWQTTILRSISRRSHPLHLWTAQDPQTRDPTQTNSKQHQFCHIQYFQILNLHLGWQHPTPHPKLTGLC